MILTSPLYTAMGPYTGNSKFDFWKHIDNGDTFYLTYKLEGLGRGGSGLYAPNVTIHCNGESFTCSVNKMHSYLNKVFYCSI